jgi:hypothetical protein
MHLPEDAAPIGRPFSPHLRGAGEGEVGDGRDMIATLSEAASSAGVELRTGHRVSQAVVSDSGAVVGVVADTRHGQATLRARRGVVFASGGFTHNAELRRNYLPAPVLSGCAASSNTGDFLPIALALGADLVNMGAAWLAPMVLDHALGNDPEATCCFNIPGDSMIFVNRSGRRVVNEKAPYHDLSSAFWAWESQSAQYPNMVLVMIWDDSARAHYSTDQYGSPMTPDGSDQSHIVSAPDLDQLASALRTRLTDSSDRLGGWQLEDRFETNLRETILRYNTQARAGLDQDFRRGETPIEQAFHGPARTGNAMNPTMWPISSEGPYQRKGWSVPDPPLLNRRG